MITGMLGSAQIGLPIHILLIVEAAPVAVGVGRVRHHEEPLPTGQPAAVSVVARLLALDAAFEIDSVTGKEIPPSLLEVVQREKRDL